MMTPLDCVETFSERIDGGEDSDEILEQWALIKRTVTMVRFSMRDILDQNHSNAGAWKSNLHLSSPT